MRVAIVSGNADVESLVRSGLRDCAAEIHGLDADALEALVTVAAQPADFRAEALQERDVTRLVEAGVFQTVRAMQDALPRLAAGARIVLISACGPTASPGPIGTAIIEASLISLARSTAAEFAARRIGVNAMLLRHGASDGRAFKETLAYLLRSPASVTGLALPVPCACRAAAEPALAPSTTAASSPLPER